MEIEGTTFGTITIDGKTYGHLEKLLPLAIADSSGVNVNESERERSGIIRGQFYGVWRGGAIFRGAHQTMVRSRTSRSRPLFSAPNSKLFAGNYGCNHRRRLGAWHAPGRRWEPECEAVRLRVAQVVKVQAGCVAIWQRLRASGRPACHHR